jgi:hypothetical protein
VAALAVRARGLLLAALLAAPAPAPALVPELGPAEIEQALEAGGQAIAQEDFAEEWRLPLPDGGEIAVATPFSRLALAARQAAVRGEPLSDKQRQEQVDRGKGRIQLLVTMHGTTADFARWYQAVLLVDGREVKASFSQNERTALPVEAGRFAARNVYVFSLEGLPAEGTVTLVVSHQIDRREVLRAPIDLSRFR